MPAPLKNGITTLTISRRLSLLNYNDRLFERYLCLLLAEDDQKWHHLTDAYGAQLWDIEPIIRVAGIGDYKKKETTPELEAYYEPEYLPAARGESPAHGSHRATRSVSSNGSSGDSDTHVTDTSSEPDYAPPASHSEVKEDDVVLLDGCFAAKVHWDEFKHPFLAQRSTFLRTMMQIVFFANLFPILQGLVLVLVDSPGKKITFKDVAGTDQDVPVYWPSGRVVGASFLIYSSIVCLLAPAGILWKLTKERFGISNLPSEDSKATSQSTRLSVKSSACQ